MAMMLNSNYYGHQGGKKPQASFEDSYSVSHGYKSVKRWTRKTDLFTKEYILVPICQDQHWTLAVICKPHLIEKLMRDHIAECKDPNRKA